MRKRTKGSFARCLLLAGALFGCAEFVDYTGVRQETVLHPCDRAIATPKFPQLWVGTCDAGQPQGDGFLVWFSNQYAYAEAHSASNGRLNRRTDIPGFICTRARECELNVWPGSSRPLGRWSTEELAKALNFAQLSKVLPEERRSRLTPLFMVHNQDSGNFLASLPGAGSRGHEIASPRSQPGSNDRNPAVAGTTTMYAASGESCDATVTWDFKEPPRVVNPVWYRVSVNGDCRKGCVGHHQERVAVRSRLHREESGRGAARERSHLVSIHWGYLPGHSGFPYVSKLVGTDGATSTLEGEGRIHLQSCGGTGCEIDERQVMQSACSGGR